MPYPTLEQYNQAFQAHSRLLTDPELRAGKLATTSLGLPLAISGGFALTYTISAASGKYAVRCFHREAKGLERRYAAISKRLESLRSPYFLPFKFDPRGITVEGKPQPIVKMAWAQGATLGEFLEANQSNASALTKLSGAIDALASYLEREGIAHGDVQTGNLMVSNGGAAIQLIDYDGMYVDEIKDLGSAELGHINFQHPKRAASNPFGPGLDRFSFIALSLAIKALRADPSLWSATRSEAEAIVFRANDFADPEASDAFAALASNPSLVADAKNFAAICKSPVAKVPTLSDFVAGRSIPSAAVDLSGLPKPNAAPALYASPYAVAPADDYARCLKLVGDRVEVVGRVVEVSEKKSRYGKPYVFVNFGSWRGEIFKISIWSGGLAAIKAPPDQSWVGQWVSVVGLMEPPYRSNRYKYSHLSINVEASNQLTRISEPEALWRLGRGAAPAGLRPRRAPTPDNRGALDAIKSGAPASPRAPTAAAPRAPSAAPAASPAAPSASSRPRTKNEEALDKIRSAQPRPAASQRPRSSASGGHYQPPPLAPSSATGAGENRRWIVGALVMLGAAAAALRFGGASTGGGSAYAPPPPTAQAPLNPPAAAAAPVEKPPRLAEKRPALSHRGAFTPAEARYCAATSGRVADWTAIASTGSDADRARAKALGADFESRCRNLKSDELAPAMAAVEPHKEVIRSESIASWQAWARRQAPSASSAAEAAASSASAAAIPVPQPLLGFGIPPVSPPSAPSLKSQPAMPSPAPELAPPETSRVPPNAQLNRYGGGWSCRRGFVLSGAECVEVKLPANAQLDYSGHGWACARGFVSLGAECAPVQMPENAQLDYSGHGWACKRGFVSVGSACVPVQIPANAQLDYSGHGWTCSRGYFQVSAECAPVQMPANAQLDYSGHGWVCSRGFVREGALCAPVQVPANAALDYSGHRWACNRGFREVAGRCSPL